MGSQDSFLEFHIGRLLDGLHTPVDLDEVSRRLGATIHSQEMIPEAVMQVKEGTFHIYLQSNFVAHKGLAERQRFSFAHEIAHTLFYERRDGELRSRKGAPVGDQLERACNRGAAMILVPTSALRERIADITRADAVHIAGLARDFIVSVETMVRRLHDIGAFDSGDYVPVLTRKEHSTYSIEYAVYPPWLQCHLPPPKRGADFATWFRPSDRNAPIFQRHVAEGELMAQPVDLSASLRVFEVVFFSNTTLTAQDF